MGNELPPHLRGLPKIRDWELLTEAYSDAELIEFHRRANELLRNNGLAEHPTAPSYLLLGNYDNGSDTRDGPRDRLETARKILDLNQATNFAILLDDLDPENDRWDNWYLKFQFTPLSTDYNVLIAEDNDGGHELELGEIPLEETYVAKREYTHASLDKDIEYEKFDGMMATLFDFLARAGRLYRWQDETELTDAVVQICIETT